MPEFKFLPNLSSFIRSSRGRGSDTGNPVAHAITGSPGALSGPWGTVFDPARAGWDIEEAVRKGIERVVWVFRCIDTIAGNQAWLPLIQRRDDPLNGEIIDKSEYIELFNMLNRRTNSYEDSFMFRYRTSSVVLLSKRGAFIEIVRDKSTGKIVNAHLLPPGQVEPIPDPKTFVAGYRLTTVDRSETILPPEKVLWLRTKPHPTDPYAQMTPLMAAGLAAETDWLARTFNRNFLLNDGRPGMLVAIRGKLGITDAKEIKDRFRGGVDRAGTTTVIEADGADVLDLGANPRDVQWLEGIKGSKDDILLAFGVPESVMGNASGRTFDNADAESEGFWEGTMQSHCNPLARGMDPLTGDVYDDIFMSYDYDNVDVLQRRKRARHDKLASDYQAGLITFDEYLEGVGKKPINVPASRVYFHPLGIPIAKNEEDTAYVAKMPIIGAPAPQDPGTAARQGAQQGALDGQRTFDNLLSSRAFQLSRPNPPAQPSIASPPRPRAQRMLLGSGKALTSSQPVQYKDVPLDVHPYQYLRQEMEGAITGALDVWSSFQVETIAERLDHVKVRRHTRHWEGEGVGTKALNTDYLVESSRWESGLKTDMTRLLRRHARQTLKATAQEMDVSGVARVMHKRGQGNPSGRSSTARVFGSTSDADSAVSDLLSGLEDVIAKAALNQSERVKDKIRQMDADGASLKEMKDEVRRMTGTGSSWRKQLATYLTTAVVEGVQHRAWEAAGDLVSKTWNTTADEKVRLSHREADGQTVGVQEKFKVASGRLSFPGDPEGAIGETANCRCWLGYSISEEAGSEFDEAF